MTARSELRPRVATPVGDAEHRDVDLDRLAGREIVVDGARRQRPLVHQKAEPQVVAGQRGDVVDQTLAGAQPAEDLGRQLRPADVVLEERRRGPSAVTARVSGLAMSCSSAPKRSACPRVSSLASGSASTAASAGPVLAEHRRRITLEFDRRLQRRERVVVDIEVVVVALLDRRAARRAPAAPPRSRRSCEPARGPATARSLTSVSRSSANTRSAATRPARLPRRRPAAASRRQRVKPSSATMRDSRSTRSGSALNDSGPTLRSRRASRSATPPQGSISSPLSRAPAPARSR